MCVTVCVCVRERERKREHTCLFCESDAHVNLYKEAGCIQRRMCGLCFFFFLGCILTELLTRQEDTASGQAELASRAVPQSFNTWQGVLASEGCC